MDIDVEAYYKKYGPMVLRRCRFLLGDENNACDAMQEVFVKLLRYQKKIRHAYPSSMLYRIATNTCLNMIRENKKREAIVRGDDLLTKIAASEDFEDRIITRNYLDFIFQKEKISTREIAVLHYVDKMTLQEVADETGLSVSGVRKRLRGLKEKVRELSQEENDE